jgi:hypothetical protein
LATEQTFASRRAAGRELARQRARLPSGLPERGDALAQNNDGPVAALAAALDHDPPPHPFDDNCYAPASVPLCCRCCPRIALSRSRRLDVIGDTLAVSEEKRQRFIQHSAKTAGDKAWIAKPFERNAALETFRQPVNETAQARRSS